MIAVDGGLVGDGTPQSPLAVGIRRLQRVVGQCNDGRDSGVLDCRVLTFTKTREDTLIHFAWSDNRNAVGYAYGYWEILYNGQPCTSPAPNRYWHHSYSGGSSNYNNNHYNATIMGVCGGTAAGPLGAGQHVITIRVVHVGGNSNDWYVGWDNSTFMLEAEEVY